MSKLSEKPTPVPRPLLTRDHILMILDQHHNPLSTNDILRLLRKNGTYSTFGDAQARRALREEQLNPLRRLGHIELIVDGEYGPKWRRVVGHVVPKHKTPPEHLKIRAWVRTLLAERGPQTAAQLAAMAVDYPDIAKLLGDNPGARIGGALYSAITYGEIEAHDPPSGHKGKQYRLPGQHPTAFPKRPTAPPRETKPLSELQTIILRKLKRRPATAAELAEDLIRIKLLTSNPQASRGVGSACCGLVRRGLAIAQKQGFKTVYKLNQEIAA